MSNDKIQMPSSGAGLTRYFDEKERKAALKQTKKTIDMAARLDAQAVVLHCGRVEVPDRTSCLIGLYMQGLQNTNKFRSLRKDIIQERKALAAPFFAQALRSLKDLNRDAEKCGVSLGVETRFYYREIPAFEEIGTMLREFKNSRVFYWHDTGHAQVRQALGFNRHKDYLLAYGKHLLGIHLHDVSGCSDHQAPGKGKLDFVLLKPFLKVDTLKVIEAHQPATANQLIKSRKFLKGVFDAE